MRSERICSLGRKLRNISADFADTYADQWLERTLDDSAIRRMDIPEMFLLAESVLIALDNVTDGLVVFPAMIKSQLDQELPFMATENIMMKLVAHGVSRQDAHEQIRVLSRETIHAVKVEGGRNDLIERMKKDEFFVSLRIPAASIEMTRLTRVSQKPIWGEIDGLLDAKLFIGRSAEIVERYAGAGGPVEEKLARYNEHIQSATTAQLSL